jgi:endoglucanase
VSDVQVDGPLRSGTALHDDAAAFLDTYVEDGRVVRTDQDGDTVSEGQAYAMLLAVAIGDEDTFREVWSWTQDNLGRPDGLVSWRWTDGEVADASSASDADLDLARALVVGAEVFDDPQLARDGVALGDALLDHESVVTPAGRVLVAGQWATTAPYAFNPSYVSPVATTLLEQASGDPRWAELETGSRAAVEQSGPDGQLPPDWALVQDDGRVDPTGGPNGEPVRFGYDAARTLIRHAESCDEADRAYVTRAGAALTDDDPAVAVYDLGGGPQTSDESPLTAVSQAAVLASDGEPGPAEEALGRGSSARDRAPTYYGDAWAALGPILLQSDVLGGCPVLEASA